MTLINWNILSDPRNWIIIFLVLYVVALVVKVLFDAAQGNTVLQLPQGL